MKRLLLALAAFVGIAGGLSSEMSFADDVVYISDAEDMEKIRENPKGSYALTNDIDMSGIDWEPVTFSGTLNGFGCAILNLKVSQVGTADRNVYAANMTTVDSRFSGLFDVLENATVSNLALYGININVEYNENIFVGGLAGYAYNSNVVNCRVEGTVSLTTKATFFGTGGIVGFCGGGNIRKCATKLEIISTDVNSAEGNEQFLGGVFAAGYADVSDCDLEIKAYDSNHGYVHNGGIAGQYNIFPADNQFYGHINNNGVKFSISYFEDISDARDHCAEGIGEMVSTSFEYSGNIVNFEPSKKDDFDNILMPHSCSNAEFTKEKIESDCTEFPYTLYTCSKCGYSYKANYEKKKHEFAPGEVLKEATDTEEGQVKLSCLNCGENIYLNIPVGSVWKDETTPEETSTEASTTEKETQKETTDKEISDDETTAKTTQTAKNTEPIEIVTAEPDPASPESKSSENRKSSGTDIGFFVVILFIVCIPAVGILVYRITKKKRKRRNRRKNNKKQQ